MTNLDRCIQHKRLQGLCTKNSQWCSLTAPVPVVEEAKFLGVVFDRKLSFIAHLKHLKDKCTKANTETITKRPRNASCLYSFYTLKWCGYPMVKKIQTYLYWFWHDPRTWKNCHFHVPQPIFLFPLETPLRLSRNMLHGWKDNSMLAKRLAACTYLSYVKS